MAVVLLAATALTAATGWMYTTDRYWGEVWVEQLRGGGSDILLALATIHVLGIGFTSLRQRENLAAAMLHGRKRPRELR